MQNEQKPGGANGRVEPLVGRYVLHPGYVTSKTDGDRHHISASRLAQLYGLRLADCIVMHNDEAGVRGYQQQSGDVHLYPRFDGNYSLPPNAAVQPPSAEGAKVALQQLVRAPAR